VILITDFIVDKWRLEKLLDSIYNGQVQLPEFQRPWIWDDEHIKMIIASISHGYPIGTILMLDCSNNDLNFATRTAEGVTSENISPEKIILDGQQRLTALFQSLYSNLPANPKSSMSSTSGKRLKRWYYMEIEKAITPGEENIEDSIKSSSEKLDTIDEYEKLVFPLSKTFSFSDWKDMCWKHLERDEETLKKLNLFEENIIKDGFLYYHVPYVSLAETTPFEAICPIFERINSTGVNLDVFDLLTAIYAAKGFNLRADWDVHRTKLLNEYNVLEDFRGTDFLKIISLLATYDPHKTDFPSCTRKAILNLLYKDYKKWVDVAAEGLKKAANLLASQKIFDKNNLPYTTQLIPLSAIFGVLGDETDRGGSREKIIRWYWCGVLGELYSGTTDTRFAKDLVEVVDWIENEDLEPTAIYGANFSSNRLLKLKDRRSAAFKGICALLLNNGVKDFYSNKSIDLESYYERNINVHHIFPKKWCEMNKIDGDRRNCIVNKTPLSKRTNNKIRDLPPSDHLRLIEKDARIKPSNMDKILESHFIKPKFARSDDFDSFFSYREQKLLEIIESAMGKEISDLHN